MPRVFLKFIPVLFLWVVFTLAVFQIPYPENLTQTNILQILGFFTPFFLAISLTINIFLKNIFLSSSISLGIIFLLILKALDSLNLVTGAIIVVATILLVSYFRKVKRKSLTKLPKIPKLTHWRKHNVSS